MLQEGIQALVRLVFLHPEHLEQELLKEQSQGLLAGVKGDAPVREQVLGILDEGKLSGNSRMVHGEPQNVQRLKQKTSSTGFAGGAQRRGEREPAMLTSVHDDDHTVVLVRNGAQYNAPCLFNHQLLLKTRGGKCPPLKGQNYEKSPL